MAVGAVLFAIITVLVGVLALGDVVTATSESSGRGLKTLAATHVTVALTGVIVLFVALVDVSQGTGWLALVVLLVAGAMGVATLARTRPIIEAGQQDDDEVDVEAALSEDAGPGADQATDGDPWALPPQSISTSTGRVPLPVVVIHGAAALLTVLLVFLALSHGGLARR